MPNLSQSGVQAIFGGDVRHWNDVPGATRGSNTIDVFVRTAASGTQDAFDKIFMAPEKVDNSIAKQLASNGLIQQKVKSDKDGVGYVSLFFAKGAHARPIRESPAPPEREVRPVPRAAELLDGDQGQQPAAAIAFIHWVQHSSAAQQIVGTQWVPLH